jgi:hypothetical protein
MEVVNILGGTKKKSRLLETTSDNPELYLSDVTVKKQPMRTRVPGELMLAEMTPSPVIQVAFLSSQCSDTGTQDTTLVINI